MIHFSQRHQHSCHRFLFFLGGSSSFWALNLVVHQPCNAENRHLSPASQPISFLMTWHSVGRQYSQDVRVQVPLKQYLHVCRRWTYGYFCLGYFSSSTHFDLAIRLAQKVWRQWVLVFAHERFRDGNCIGLLANTGLFLSTGNRYLFSPSTPIIPFDS